MISRGPETPPPEERGRLEEHPLLCSEALRQMYSLVEDGALKEAERSLLFAHLHHCPACRDALLQWRRLDARLKRTLGSLQASPELGRRIRSSLPEIRSVRAELPSGFLKPLPDRTTRAWKWLRWPALMAGMIGLAMLTPWGRQRLPETMDQTLPMVESVEGTAWVSSQGSERPLAAGGMLHSGDTIAVAGTAKESARFLLSSEQRPVAELNLAPDAILQVVSRGRFVLRRGEADFSVRRERPKTVGEVFAVETPLGEVRVTGTIFHIQVPADHPREVKVMVKEGQVQVLSWDGQIGALSVNQECELLAAGGFTVPHSAESKRIYLAIQPPSSPEPKLDPVRPSEAIRSAADWSVPVGPIDLRGETLVSGLHRLARLAPRVSGLDGLAERASAWSQREKSELAIQTPIPLDAAIRWLAREVGLRFDPTSKSFCLPGAEEELGLPETGAGPPWLEERMKAEGSANLASRAAGPKTLAAALDSWAEQTGVTLFLDRTLPAEVRQSPLETLPPARSAATQLDRVLADRHLAWAFYDGLILISVPERIERLTRVTRIRAASEWIGSPPDPEWSLALKSLVAQYTRGFAGAPAGTNLEVHPDGPELYFVSGILGARALDELLIGLGRCSPTVPLVAENLDERIASGFIRDFQDLAKQAAERGVGLEFSIPASEFPLQSFQARSLPLGKALDWAARLQGLGIRPEAGGLALDRVEACYGAPELQVLDLTHLMLRDPRLDARWPGLLASRIAAHFPELLAGVRFYPLRNRLVFRADRRQLRAAQSVLFEMEDALRQGPGPFEAGDWNAAWKSALNQNLKEPFRGDGSGMLEGGSFVALLRGSGQFAQLRASLVVDPQAMQRVAFLPVEVLPVQGKSVQAVLEALANAVGLRIAIEDGMVWLREQAGPASTHQP